MPKISEDVARKRKVVIEKAAIRLFVKRGFHAVGLREICDEAGVSIGNVYNHFDSKDAIFRASIARLYDEFRAPDQPLALYLARQKFPDDVPELALAIESMVKRFRDYLVLVFVDVVEFDGRHVAVHYEDLVEKFRPALGAKAFDFAAAYMQFFNYFIVKHIFGVKRHFSTTDDAAVVRGLAKLFGKSASPKKARKPRKAGRST